MSAVLQESVISQKQVAAYRQDGFVVVEDIFSEEEIGQMVSVLDDLVDKAKGLIDHDDIYDLELSHTPEAPRVRRIKLPFKVHPIYRQMAEHPRLIAVLSQLLGPDLRLHGGKINLKSADFGAAVEWHQDWAFYPHTNDDVLAVGVMLNDMTMDNGPMLMMPGSHRGPIYDHHQDGRFVGGMDPVQCMLDFSTALPVTGKMGACSFHHVRAIHGSAQNTSGEDRRLLLYQVAAADAWDLSGMKEGSWAAHEGTMLAGSATNEPRLTSVPVRLPYPGPELTGSIYESQSILKNSYFERK
jgi:ectoine hydroxylase-related dioxygenase (phytanoyl-CoA dioxygenase family)